MAAVVTDASQHPDNGTTTSAGDSVAPAEPAQRGRLVVADRAVEKIAIAAASEISGVQSAGSTLDGVIGRAYPQADVQVAGGHAKVSLELAVTWPSPLAPTTAAVRDRVRDRLETLAGLRVDRVDVTVAKLVQAEPKQERRVT